MQDWSEVSGKQRLWKAKSPPGPCKLSTESQALVFVKLNVVVYLISKGRISIFTYSRLQLQKLPLLDENAFHTNSFLPFFVQSLNTQSSSSATALPQFTHMHETLSSNWMPSSITVPTKIRQSPGKLPKGQWTPTEIRRGWERSPGTAGHDRARLAPRLFHQVSLTREQRTCRRAKHKTHGKKEKLRSISTTSPSTSPVKDTGALTPGDKGSSLGETETVRVGSLSNSIKLTPQGFQKHPPRGSERST